MFILKLGAEALSLKSETVESKFKENKITCSSDVSSASSSLSDTCGHMLENLLNGGLVESALLGGTTIKRCRSATNTPRSVFLQPSTTQSYRPRSDTVPQIFSISDNGQRQQRKRKLHSDSQGPGQLNPLQLAISTQSSSSSFSTMSVDETKLLRQQINILLKKIMQIIKTYSNYSSVSESRRLHFVTNLWHKIIVLAILQMDTESCRLMFRWLLLSIFNGKDEIDCSRRDKILLLEKLQEYVKSYTWLKNNAELLHCILFWFFSKYGYPYVFFMSPQTVMCKLNELVLGKGQLDSVLKLIHELSELTESHVRHLFCQHLPTASSMAEFLIQWT